jgi:hypothetical protein
MPTDPSTVRRTLHVKFTLAGGDAQQLSAMMQAAAPFWQAFGGAQMTLLQNADDPARFLQAIEYDTPAALEANRQQVASDPRVQAYLQAVRALVPGAVEIDVYREAGAGEQQ